MTAFLIKSSLSMLVFLLFYKLVLEREKMHRINRFLLIFALVFSVVIPFVSFELISENPIVKQSIPSYVLSEIYIGNQEVETAKFFTSEIIFRTIYGLGFLVFLFRFVRNLTLILRRIHESEKIKKDGFTLVLVEKNVLPHSFLNSVFVNRNEYENNLINEELFVHEKAHVTQKHSLDILFVEVLQVMFWFNPIIYLYKKAIKLNHEFLADQKVNETFREVVHYQKLLLHKAVGNSLIPIASNLNYSVTKKRFIMMTKSTSKLNLISKTCFSFVLFFAMFFTFSVNGQETKVKKELKEPKYEIPNAETRKLKEVSKEEYQKYFKLMEEQGADTKAYYVGVEEGESEKDNSVPHVTVSYDYIVEQYPEYFDPETKEPLEHLVESKEVTLPNGKTVYEVNSKYEQNEAKVIKGNYQESNKKEKKADRWTIEYSVETKYDPNTLSGQEPVHTSAEVMPEYPEGINEFRKFVMSNFKAPDVNVDLKGSVIVTFVVEKDGTLSNIRSVQDLGHGTGEEAVRVVGLSEKWKPGIQGGKPVRVSYTLPIAMDISSK